MQNKNHLAKFFEALANELSPGQVNPEYAQAVEELRSQKAKDEAILDSIGEGLILTDEVGRILKINGTACYYFNLNSAQVKGRPLIDVIKITDEKGYPISSNRNPVALVISTHKRVTQVVVFTRPNGSKNILDMNVTPVAFQGKDIGCLAVIRDVTKEKEIDRMKTEFISLASHQLRTPLSAIKWFTEMLAAGDAGQLNPEQLEFVKNISDSTQRMIQLVNSLLNISRIESGRIIIDPRPTDLKELVEEVVQDLRAKIAEKNQHLIISVHESLPRINVDPRLIRQVYLNLLSNAVKYTPPNGEISVFISRKGENIISQVSDDGYGIPKAQQGKVFQKFFRADNAIKVETDGTGLGLYLIKAIVESSTGQIWFESEEGKGTTFWFSLPLSGTPPKAGEVTLDG